MHQRRGLPAGQGVRAIVTMQISLSAGSMAALFGAMVMLALMPSASVLAVVARAAASGFRHGVYTALGIVTGDIVFIGIAILGLAALANILGELFVLVRYFGGVWLIWLGISLWQPRTVGPKAGQPVKSSCLSSFLTGLLITLADQKAILFYLGFFPAFLDLSAITPVDAALVIAITFVAVGGAKLGYAWTAARGKGVLAYTRWQQWITRGAAGVLMGIGLILIVGA